MYYCCHFLLSNRPPLLFSVFVLFLIAISLYKHCIFRSSFIKYESWCHLQFMYLHFPNPPPLFLPFSYVLYFLFIKSSCNFCIYRHSFKVSGCVQKWVWDAETQCLCWSEGIVPWTGRSWNMVGFCCHMSSSFQSCCLHMLIIFLFSSALFSFPFHLKPL